MPGKKPLSSIERDFSDWNEDSDSGEVKQLSQHSRQPQSQQQYRPKLSQINHGSKMSTVIREPPKQIITKQIPSVLKEEDLQVKILDLKEIFATKLTPERPKYFQEIVERNKHAMAQKSMVMKIYSKPIFARRKHAQTQKLRAFTKMPRKYHEPKRDKRKHLEANSAYYSNEVRSVGPNRELIVTSKIVTSKMVNLNEPQQQHATRTADNSLTIIKSKKDRARRRKSKSERRIISGMASTSKINDKSGHHKKRKRKVKLNRQKTMPLSLYKAVTNFLDNLPDE